MKKLTVAAHTPFGIFSSKPTLLESSDIDKMKKFFEDSVSEMTFFSIKKDGEVVYLPKGVLQNSVIVFAEKDA